MKHKLILDEVILKQFKKAGKNKQVKDILSKMFDKIEEKGPNAGKLLDVRLKIYKMKLVKNRKYVNEYIRFQSARSVDHQLELKDVLRSVTTSSESLAELEAACNEEISTETEQVQTRWRRPKVRLERFIIRNDS